MRGNNLWLSGFLFGYLCLLTGCSTTTTNQTVANADPRHMPLYMRDPVATDLPLYQGQAPYSPAFDQGKYIARLPQTIDSPGKTLIFDPKIYAWGAYQDGTLVRGGVASGGADFCRDISAPCRTNTGNFRVFSMGDETCFSRQFPPGKGGALMPYCMFFSNGQSFHGSPDQMMMVEANISHGCIHMRIPDAAWLRYNFVNIGTKVVILPYDNNSQQS